MPPIGRPAIVTPQVIQKLEEAFALGCTDLEACLMANISKSTLYNYQDTNPDFLERKEKLKESPVLLARTTVVNKIATDADLAMKYLERKCKKEFSTKTETELFGKDGGAIKQSLTVEYIDSVVSNE